MKSNSNKITYCPVCRNKLEGMDSVDVLVDHYMCQNKHRYYHPVEEVFTHQTGAEYINLRYAADDLKEVIKAWLSKADYRRHLNNQLAEILRVYLDIKENIYSIEAQKERRYKYCLFCGETLSEFETNDLYASGLRCKNDHVYHLRGCLYPKDEKSSAQLCQYMDYDFFVRCIDNFLDNKHFKEFVPNQIREILLTIKSESSK